MLPTDNVAVNEEADFPRSPNVLPPSQTKSEQSSLHQHVSPSGKLTAREEHPQNSNATPTSFLADIDRFVKNHRNNGLTLRGIAETVTDELARVDNYYISISDPFDCSFRHQPSSSFLRPYFVMRNFSVQVTLAIVFMIGFIMVLVQGFSGKGSTSWFTFFSMLAFSAEMVIIIGLQKTTRLTLRDRYWRCVEPLAVWLCLLLELVSWIVWGHHRRRGYDNNPYIALTWIRLICWVLHAKSRWERLEYGLRAFCSADRRRYVSEGVDLDYSYIHRNIVAMAWPAFNYERIFRNAVEDVSDFLHRKHPNAFLVVNLCSERTYSPSYFNCQTAWYPMDDHNPAELDMMVAFCRETKAFVSEDPYSRLIAVHCKGGKGRTGTMICAYLMYVGLKCTADSALRHFALLRTKPGAGSFQGVQAPSQERYVRYFERLLTFPQLRVPQRRIRFRGLMLHNIPWIWYKCGIGKLWFVIITKPCTDRTLRFISNDTVTFNPHVPDPSSYTAKQIRDLCHRDDDYLYQECNEIDPKDVSNDTGHGYQHDKESFSFVINQDFSRHVSYDEFYRTINPNQYGAGSAGTSAAQNVSLVLNHPEKLPSVSGDVVIKFFFAHDNPNPLEPPVQVWLHTAFETASELHLQRDQIDGPPKDKHAERYPVDFAITINIEEVSDSDENSREEPAVHKDPMTGTASPVASPLK